MSVTAKSVYLPVAFKGFRPSLDLFSMSQALVMIVQLPKGHRAATAKHEDFAWSSGSAWDKEAQAEAQAALQLRYGLTSAGHKKQALQRALRKIDTMLRDGAGFG